MSFDVNEGKVRQVISYVNYKIAGWTLVLQQFFWSFNKNMIDKGGWVVSNAGGQSDAGNEVISKKVI